MTVPTTGAPTIQAAVDDAVDRNHDGRTVIAVRAGLYRESVVIDRTLELIGEGRDLTILQGDGSGPVLTATAPDVVVRGVAAVGGTRGVELAGANGRLLDSVAWRNLREGVLHHRRRPAKCGSATSATTAATASRCRQPRAAPPASSTLAARQRRQRRHRGRRRRRACSTTAPPSTPATALALSGASDATVTGNRIAVNFGAGIFRRERAQRSDRRQPQRRQHEDGLHLDRCDDAIATGNTLDDNHGYGIFLRRSDATDFAAAAGLQPPPGDNIVSGNRKGDVFVRPD